MRRSHADTPRCQFEILHSQLCEVDQRLQVLYEITIDECVSAPASLICPYTCHACLMRRLSLFIQVIAAVIAGCSIPISAASAAIQIAPPCGAASVRVTEYNTSVGAGSVNDLYWIRNVTNQSCSIRGYVRVAFVGVYGLATGKLKNVHTLSVRVGNSRSGGSNGNDAGGVKSGPIPVVGLAPRGVASFWIYGTDESSHLMNGQLTRCITSYRMLVWLPGSERSNVVAPLPANGFYWCGGIVVHPVVAGRSGSQPARSLSYFFGAPG